MLLRFTVRNFLSFKEEAVLDLQPSQSEQAHPGHVMGCGHGFSALRLAVIYGANAAGKSNLVKALDFATRQLGELRAPESLIDARPFRLDREGRLGPSTFSFLLAIRGGIYEYGFAVNRERFVEEWLYRVRKAGEEMLFERSADTSVHISKAGERLLAMEPAFLDVWKKRTQRNTLLASEGARIGIDFLSELKDLLHGRVVVIPPGATSRDLVILLESSKTFRTRVEKFLAQCDTGIAGLSTERVEVDEDFREAYNERLAQFHGTLRPLVGDSLAAVQSMGELPREVVSVGTVRRTDPGGAEPFGLEEESDGTQRLLHLSPILFEDPQGKRIHVVDELDRSLHPLLSRLFLSRFLATEGGNQLIVTTHDASLLDTSLLRKDEIWFAEKDLHGSTTLYSLSSVKGIPQKAGLEKGYLEGRFGAVPALCEEQQVYGSPRKGRS